MPYTRLAGLPVYYEQAGPVPVSEVVVFFNGWCLSARYWQLAAARLAVKWPLVLFDSRGFGRSQVVTGPAYHHYHSTIDSGASEAIEFLTGLGLPPKVRYHVVGHSLGAVTAAHFASQVEAEQCLASLTIINSGSFGPEDPAGSQLENFIKLFVKIKRWFNLPLVRQAVVARSVAQPIPAQFSRVITEDFALADERLALELSLSSLSASNLDRYRQELTDLRSSLLLVVGDRDATIPPKGMYNIARFKPAARLVPFPDCGHLPMLEQPERFSQVLTAHFEQAQSRLQSPSTIKET